jgi:hypothetical protein
MKAFLSSLRSKTGRLEPTARAYLHLSKPHFWTTKYTDIQLAAGTTKKAKMEEAPNYMDWSQERLIERVTQLEQELKEKNSRYKSCCLPCSALSNRL